jgi:lambda repressor-like predicted transcriptional regulator
MDASLTDAITEAANDVDRAVARRSAAIRAAHAAGLSLRTIADAAGMSHEAVRQLLARHSAPAPWPDNNIAIGHITTTGTTI